MSRYPDNPRPISPYTFRVNRPFLGGGPEWAQQTRPLTRFSLFEADLSYRGKSFDQIMILHAFFESVDGAAGRFTFVDFNGIGPVGSGTDPGVPWKSLFVAKGDGATGSWDMPTFGIKASVTTVVAAVDPPGERTVTPVSMSGILVGSQLTVADADGTAGEVVVVTAITATTFTAVFANAHAANWLVNAPLVFENGVPKTTTFTSSPAAGAYGIAVGTGTDGVDLLKAGTDPASTVVVTTDAICRRAERRARFIIAKNPFVLNVPANYYQGPVTIVGVRK